ncbi:ankyrin repeat and SAM domain-containing protein 6-like [Senna tora]|uniref:Ankyrin repeat and SAM domain-containing protein 6-like n=1 Tax=Senna tora TaxID=362788 RepID=A0A835CKD8_9FABA|nr:ankyrin repeat and SAM domain-containing protein 6-like [Senna tora]
MYADRVESGARRSVRDRLNENFGSDSTRQRSITGKRQRQDDKWEHDLFEDDKPRVSNRQVTAQDLRLKLQKKGLQPASQGGKNSIPGMRDLREKLSGTMTTQPKNSDPPKSKVEAVKPSSKSIIVEAPASQIKRAANPAPKKKASQKADSSVDGFLLSLGLEKYLITFQAEEVDMTALMHMTDEDLKAMGIPMGPRKKILLALESKG